LDFRDYATSLMKEVNNLDDEVQRMATPPKLGRSLPFKPIREDWNRYELEGGAILEIKVEVTKVYETEGTEPDGAPNVYIQSHNVLRVFPPQKKTD